MTESRLDRIKDFLDSRYSGYQTFYTQNIFGDYGQIVFVCEGASVIHYPYDGYIEVLGLTEQEVRDLREYGYYDD